MPQPIVAGAGDVAADLSTWLDLKASTMSVGLDSACRHERLNPCASPNPHPPRFNLGTAFLNKGWVDKAIEQYQSVLKMRPDYALARKNLAIAVQQEGSGNE